MITEEQFNEAHNLIKAYQEQLKQADVMRCANAYKDLKAFLQAKKSSRILCFWDDVHHQEIWDKMLELEKKHSA
jgi:uncharacterized protein YxeA